MRNSSDSSLAVSQVLATGRHQGPAVIPPQAAPAPAPSAATQLLCGPDKDNGRWQVLPLLCSQIQRSVSKRSQPSTGVCVSLSPAGPSWAAVLSSALSAQTSRNPSPPAQPGVRGCHSDPMALSPCCQVPGAGQGGGGGPGQLYRARVSTRRRGRSRARQERPVPRPVPRGRAHGPEVRPGGTWGWACPCSWPGLGCSPCCPKLCPIPGGCVCQYHIYGWDRERGWRC